MKVEVASWHSERILDPVKMDEKSQTEQSYVPPNILIEQMIAAGQRLEDYRGELYDFQNDEEIDWDYQDPTRNPGYDPADASEMLIELAKKQKAAMKEAKAEMKAAEAAAAELSEKVDKKEET